MIKNILLNEKYERQAPCHSYIFYKCTKNDYRAKTPVVRYDDGSSLLADDRNAVHADIGHPFFHGFVFSGPTDRDQSA